MDRFSQEDIWTRKGCTLNCTLPHPEFSNIGLYMFGQISGHSLKKINSVINLLVFVSQVNRQLRSEDKACTFSTCNDREKFSHNTTEDAFTDLSAFYCICNTLHWPTPDLGKCKTSSLSLRVLQAYFYTWSHGQQPE